MNIILSMLPDDEAQMLGMSGESTLCAAHGIEFLSHPITDYGLPDFDRFQHLIADLKARLESGHSIAIHCRAGIGRTGMTAACTLVALGDTAKTAMQKVSDARGVSIPDTVEQGDFIAFFAQAVNKGKILSI